MDRLAKVLQSLSGYGEMIGNVLLLLLGGMVLVIVLYRLVHAIIKPEGQYSRLVKVVFGAVYAIILVLTVLLAAEQIGFVEVGFTAVMRCRCTWTCSAGWRDSASCEHGLRRHRGSRSAGISLSVADCARTARRTRSTGHSAASVECLNRATARRPRPCGRNVSLPVKESI